MAAVSNYLANKLLDHMNGKTSYTMPTVYIALCTSAPSAGTAGTEAAYTGYTRSAAIASAMAAAASGAVTNSAGTVSFGACTAGTSSVVAFQAYDSATVGAGNPLWYGACTLAVSAGITPSFATSTLNDTLT